MVSRLVLVACLVGCGARAHPVTNAALGDDLTLYRDVAVVRQRIELDVGAKPATIKVRVAAGVRAEQLMVIDRGGLRITSIHAQTDPTKVPAPPPAPEAPVEDLDNVDPCAEVPSPEPAPEPEPDATVTSPAKPTELRLAVTAPRPGRYAVVIGYVTDRVPWDVAYTMTATPQRDRVVVRGALAIRNTTGIVLRAARARLVDAELGAWRGKTAEQLAATLVGGTQSSTAPVPPRELGAVVIGDGETRVELLRAFSRPMRSVLVYDPIGTKLDNPGATPLRDARMGAGPAPARVTESFEVTRHKAAAEGLPAGPVRLLERRADGTLVLLGESRLFEAATRVAEIDTIAVGTADGVTGTRERRELTIDDPGRRIVEEFVITVANHRAHPASVLVREHLYRGQNWTLAYPQANQSDVTAAKEGPQQISLRTVVPAKSQAKILYVVVYTWGP